MTQTRRETRISETDFADITVTLTDRARPRTRTLARALTRAHLPLADVVTVLEHASPDEDNPIPDRCAAWRLECTADGHPLTVRYDWLTPTPDRPWTVTVHGTAHHLPAHRARYFTGTAQRLAPIIRDLIRAPTE
ncbi:hypothetical protein [Streptomyces sp. NPDC059631]|uniref:hypothetical protein n=1 Tax=unclassified Streptomyces TaxID=2593676 RepID=UPI00367D603D